MTETYD